jgi:hypothetical protein
MGEKSKKTCKLLFILPHNAEFSSMMGIDWVR